MIVLEWLRRVWYLLNRNKLERELEQEMAAHREMMGEPADFGNSLRLREESRDVWGWNWLDQLGQDLRYGVRKLRHSPGFAITAVLILSLGTGLNLAFFQVVNVALLKPLPVNDPFTLVRFNRVGKHFDSSGVPYAVTQFVRRNNSVLSAVLTQTGTDVVWGDDASDRLRASFVSANWFAELGFGAVRGRVFVEETEERPDAPPVAVISYSLWQSRLESDPDIVGKTVRINNKPATVIGVASAGFHGLKLEDPQIWIPINQLDHFTPGVRINEAWTNNATDMYGRLAPGVSPSAAKDGLRAAMRQLGKERPAEYGEEQWLEPSLGRDRFMRKKDQSEMWTVMGLAGGLALVVLLVACANIGNLVLCNAFGRVRELAVRSSLGAGKWRIIRQLLTESLLLASAGSLGGMLVGFWSARLFAGFTELPPYLDFTPDLRMMSAALAIALFAMMAVGLVPAWRISRQDLNSVMKDGGIQASSGMQKGRLRQVLVASQIAGSCLLLLVAGTMVRGLQRLLTADPGFEYENVAVLDASLGRYGIVGEAARTSWLNIKERVQAHPEVESVALVSTSPLGRSLSEANFNDAPGIKVSTFDVDPEFFELMRVPILLGRNFGPGDTRQSAVIISRRLAVQMYGTMSVLGRGFPKTKPMGTIIGITGDAPLIKITAINVAELYRPLDPRRYEGLVLIARAKGDPAHLLKPMREAARTTDARLLAEARLVKSDFDRRLRPVRLSSSIASMTGFLALIFACLGIFGVVSYGVALRTKEIGIRVALGAGRHSVIRMLLSQLVLPLSFGLLAGGAGGFAAVHLLQAAPFYLKFGDPIAYALTFIIFAAAAGAAAFLPAWSALRRDPLRALRYE